MYSLFRVGQPPPPLFFATPFNLFCDNRCSFPLVGTLVKITVKQTVCEVSPMSAYGVCDWEFGSHSHEGSCSNMLFSSLFSFHYPNTAPLSSLSAHCNVILLMSARSYGHPGPRPSVSSGSAPRSEKPSGGGLFASFRSKPKEEVGDSEPYVTLDSMCVCGEVWNFICHRMHMCHCVNLIENVRPKARSSTCAVFFAGVRSNPTHGVVDSETYGMLPSAEC